MQIQQYKKDSIVFYEGDKKPYLHVLLKGSVRLYKTTPKGKEIHMHQITAPETIALFPAFQDVAFPASCEFITEGSIGLIPMPKIYECLHHVDFSISLIMALTKHMQVLANLVHKETIYSSEAKIAELILNNPSIFERLKNNEISSILNMTPETLSRILTKLKKENILTIKAHKMTILNQKALLSIMETNSLHK
jgi:CRP/FNR family transcriptional regulator